MKSILGLGRGVRPAKAPADAPDSAFFSTAFAHQGLEPEKLVLWDARATQVDARRLPARQGGKLLQALWSQDKYMAQLGSDAVERMEPFFAFAHVEAGREVIRQDEYSNFMLVLLTGTIGVDRLHAWGEPTRLAEIQPGEIVGEMSLLDSGSRFSSCTTLTECDIAVMSAAGLDDMMVRDSPLAAGLVAQLAHKLSLRLRAVSARLSEQQH